MLKATLPFIADLNKKFAAQISAALVITITLFYQPLDPGCDKSKPKTKMQCDKSKRQNKQVFYAAI